MPNKPPQKNSRNEIFPLFSSHNQFFTLTLQPNKKIDIRFERPVGHDAALLLDTMVLGLQDIQNNYGTDYSFLNFKEV